MGRECRTVCGRLLRPSHCALLLPECKRGGERVGHPAGGGGAPLQDAGPLCPSHCGQLPARRRGHSRGGTGESGSVGRDGESCMMRAELRPYHTTVIRLPTHDARSPHSALPPLPLRHSLPPHPVQNGVLVAVQEGCHLRCHRALCSGLDGKIGTGWHLRGEGGGESGGVYGQPPLTTTLPHPA